MAKDDINGFSDHQILVKIWTELDTHIIKHDKEIAKRPTRTELVGYLLALSGIIFGIIQIL